MTKVKLASCVFYLLFGAVTTFTVSAADRVIVGPPVETIEQGERLYLPLARLLSERSGDEWVYQHSDDWLSYVKLIVSDRADLTFSQAHFAGYLMLYHNHNLVVRARDDTEWFLVGNKDNDVGLAGQSVCLIPPPELGSLVLSTLKELEDPMRTPYIMAVSDRAEALSGLKAGKCAFTVVPGDALTAADRQAMKTSLLMTVPGAAITVSSRIEDEVVNRIRDALLSAEGQTTTELLRQHYGTSGEFSEPSDTNSYLLASSMLVQGYLEPMQRMDKAFETVQTRAEEIASEGEEEWVAQVDPMLVSDIRAVQELAKNRIVREAVRAQNSQNIPLTQIISIDEEWSSTEELTPFKRSLQTSEVGTLLKQSVLLNPSYTELFVTDNQGANVAAYPATSDYWQGDEDKFIESFVGNGRVFVGEQEYDESSKKVAVQVSVPVHDDNGNVSGVLVAGLVVDYLRWKQQHNTADESKTQTGTTASN